MIPIRRSYGGSMIELPLALMMILIFTGFPFMAMSTIALRLALANFTVSEAVRQAAGSKTYLQAQTGAQAEFNQISHLFPGINYTANFNAAGIASQGSLQVFRTAVAGAVGGAAPPAPSTPTQFFGGALNLGQYVYQFQVSVPTDIEPLIRSDGKIFVAVPGLTAPMHINLRAVAMCENPGGLNATN